MLKIEQDKRIASMQARMEMVEMGKQIQEKKSELMQERRDLTSSNQQGVIELKREAELKIEMLQKQHEKTIRREQDELERVIRDVEVRKLQINDEKEEIDEFVKTAEQDKKRIEKGGMNDKELKEHQELIKLITMAREKHKEISEEQEGIVEKARMEMEIKIEESERMLEEEEEKIIQHHHRSIQELEIKTEERKKELMQEQKEILKQHDDEMKDIVNNAESVQQEIKSKHDDAFKETQKKLIELEVESKKDSDEM